MKHSKSTLLIALMFLALSADASGPLRALFLNPPEEAKPRGYWIWPHGNFDYATIRKELADFKAKGLGGVDIFDIGIQDRKNVIPAGPAFMSPEQVDGIAFALREAGKLGLKMGLIVSSSWNAGGAWTPPEEAMMNLVAWQETVTGPTHYERNLPFPELPDSFSKSYGTYSLKVPRDDHGRPLFYKDIAVMACQVDEAGRVMDPAQVLLLSQQVDDSGTLICDLPEGRWLIMRTLFTNFGQHLWVPSKNSGGLTMDHFSINATRNHFNLIIDRLEAVAGPLSDTALERLYLASYESNADVIWTAGMEEEFHRFNGYRLEPFLPALFGIEVKNEETTDRFLYDFRQTASELFINNLYREASRICRDHGLLLCSESGGPGAPLHDVPTEDLKALGAVDVMRGEFWVDKSDRLDDRGLETLQVVKQIASAAHIYGRHIVEMEAFTSHENWQEGPWLLKQLADRAYCEGMTRVVYHTMSHNLPEAGVPGWTYQAGTHMNSNLTWWDLSPALHTYLARCSAMLMQGNFVADAAYYYGNAIPNFAKPKHLRPGLGWGYDYDDLNTEVLLQSSVDDQGRIVLPGGMRYPLLVLPEKDRCMDLSVLRHLEHLLRQGATLLGSKPERIYGLRGYPEDEHELLKLADKVWGGELSGSVVDRQHGKGRLVSGKSERDVLRSLGFQQDVRVFPEDQETRLDWIHRRTETADIYFLRNTSDSPLECDVRFRVTGRRPEIWDPAGGATTAVAIYQATGEGTRLPIQLPAFGSIFMVFDVADGLHPCVTSVDFNGRTVFPTSGEARPGISVSQGDKDTLQFHASRPGNYRLRFNHGVEKTIRYETQDPAQMLEGSWQVRFPDGWNVPVRQDFQSLISWTEKEDAATRNFSGTAVYKKGFFFDPTKNPALQTVLLDLGEVREIARIYLNGHELGISAFPPHQMDVTDFIRPGVNYLTVEVANTWLNRLIADDSLPEAERRTHTNLTRGPTGGQRWRDAQPLPSGLLGPVRLFFPREYTLKIP